MSSGTSSASMPQSGSGGGPAITRRVELSFLRFVRGLFYPEGADALGQLPVRALDPVAGLAGSGKNRPLLGHFGPLLAKGSWRWLTRAGGYKTKEPIASGRKRTGRIWDEAIFGKQPLTFSAGSFFWLAAFHDSYAALSTRGADAANRTLSVAAAQPLTTGDRIALSAALLPMARDRDVWRQLPLTIRALGAQLPLFGLAQPHLLPPEVPIAWKKLDETEVLIFQYLDEWLATTWADAIASRGKRAQDEARTYDAAWTKAVAALYQAAESGTRDHLLTCLARFYPQLLRRSGGSEELGRAVEALAKVIVSTADREAFERGFGTVLHGGVALEMRVQEILALPWPDRTESQKKLAAEFESHYRPVHPEIRLLSRKLRREVG